MKTTQQPSQSSTPHSVSACQAARHNSVVQSSRLLYTAFISAAALLLLPSCATLTKEECQLGDWQSIGYSDGVAGHSATRISQHQKACSKTGVSPNYQQWEAGRQQGLTHYCTQSNAYNLGMKGSRLNSVCNQKNADQLYLINADALEQYNLKRQINKDKEQLKEYQEQLTKLRNGEMLHFKTEKEVRRYLLELDDKMDELRYKIRRQQYQLDDMTRFNKF